MRRPLRYLPLFSIAALAFALVAMPSLLSPAHATLSWEGPPGVHILSADAVVFELLPGFEELTFDTNDFGSVATLESESHAALRTDTYGHGPRWAGRVKLDEMEGFAAYSQPFYNRA